MFSLQKDRIASLCVMGAIALAPTLAHADEELPEALLMGEEAGVSRADDDGRIWWLGFQLQGALDGIGSEDPQSTDYGFGMGIAIPVTMELYRGLGLRMGFAGTYSGSPPLDPVDVEFMYTLPSSATGQPTEEIVKTVDGYFVNAQLGVGLNYTHPFLNGTLHPYGGLGPAFLLTYVFPDLEPEDDVLLDLEESGSSDGTSLQEIDPYSVNVTAGFNTYGGINLQLANSVHLNFEISYTQSVIPETRLEKANEDQDYNARRSAFIYRALTFSTGLVWHF